MPTVPTSKSIKETLEKGRHVILKGPPGTGKTHLAMQTIREFIGETGAQVSIVRHQMTMYIMANSGRSGNCSTFNLSRSSPVLGEIGTDNSFYAPASSGSKGSGYGKNGQTGESTSIQIIVYDEDKLEKSSEGYVHTSLTFDGESDSPGGTIRLSKVPKQVIQQWDLLKIIRRIIIAEPDGKEQWEYHIHRYPPGSEIYQGITNKWLNQEEAPKPVFVFPQGTPPTAAAHLAGLANKRRQAIMEVIPESFVVNSSVVWDIVQFHPTYSYSDFVRGVDPDFSDGEIRFSDQKRTFLKMCESAIQNPNTPHVLIVDEINRAALGSVFGELILGLEDEYKGIPILTGNGRRITIPKNLALLGTMNSSDRSIGVIDHALKRRFEWIDLPAVSEPSEDSDIQLLKDLNDLLNPEVQEERGFGKWMIGESGKCASVAFTIIPQLETLLREGELDSNKMEQAAEKISIWNESTGGDKYKVQITDFVGQHNPTPKPIERIEVKETILEGVEFVIKLPKTRYNPEYPTATAIHNREKKTWTVLKGSGICSKTPTFGVKNTRDKEIISELLENGTISLNEDKEGHFVKDWPASSISKAARIPLRQGTANGKDHWKTEDGTTYKQWLANLEGTE